MAEEIKDQHVSMEDLKGIIAEAVKGSTKEQIEALKKEVNEVNRKHLFSEEKDRAQVGKSIIDTSFFTKNYSMQSGQKDGPEMTAQMRGMGGPFLTLSPIMEKFAAIMARGGDFGKCAQAGISINEFNAECREVNGKLLGEKAMTLTEAGVLVPVEYLATIIEFSVAQSAILPKLWRIPMGSLSLKIPKLVQASGSYFGGVTLYHPGEGGQKTATKPTMDSMTFTAKKLIGLVALTDELVADSSINIVNYITGLIVRAFQWETEKEVISGTGSSVQMTGILTDTEVNLVPRVTAGTVKYEDLINMENSLDENFNSLTWLSRRATLGTFRKQKAAAGSDQVVYTDGYNPMFSAAVPPSLIGYPVIRTRNVPALGSQGDLILGDLGFYIWAMRQDMTIDTSKDFRFDYDETTLRFVVRQDGAPAIPEAFAVLDAHMS